jgi:hypothetical protein
MDKPGQTKMRRPATIIAELANRPSTQLALQDAMNRRRIFVTPSSRTRFTKPVDVLTSPVTVSAGGLVAMLKHFHTYTRRVKPRAATCPAFSISRSRST